MEEPKKELTVEERRAKYGEQDEWGNSISDLRRNLKLTYEERIARMEGAARIIIELRNARRNSA